MDTPRKPRLRPWQLEPTQLWQGLVLTCSEGGEENNTKRGHPQPGEMWKAPASLCGRVCTSPLPLQVHESQIPFRDEERRLGRG